jgi:uncharacterized protein CbrC (UPF0167 family)
VALPIPKFTYHPDPFASGVVVGADEQCECCEEKRTLFYVGPFYAAEEVEKLCLWCVADGSAADKFDGLFVDDANFDGEEVSKEAIEEVTRRTPSYHAWQQEQWLCHCGDACEYHGYPTVAELKGVSSQAKQDWADLYAAKPGDWDRAVELFESEVAGFYKFVCKQCGLTLFAHDLS